MKIAQVAPLFESVPPRLYLTEELVRQGHQVTLFASLAKSASRPAFEMARWPAPFELIRPPKMV